MPDTYADDARKELDEIWEITEALTSRDPYRPLTKVVAKGFTAITYALIHVADVIEMQSGVIQDQTDKMAEQEPRRQHALRRRPR